MFGKAFILNEPLPVRLPGVISETVNHDGALLVGMVHVVVLLFGVTLTVVLTLVVVFIGFHDDIDVVNGCPVCVTVIVLVIPPPLTVTVPVRLSAPVLRAVFITNEPLPVLFGGATPVIVSHDALLVGVFHAQRKTFVHKFFIYFLIVMYFICLFS